MMFNPDSQLAELDWYGYVPRPGLHQRLLLIWSCIVNQNIQVSYILILGIDRLVHGL